jgi:T4 RnlA family RNA ligase
MNYEFPYITNISDVLPAIEGRDEFVVAEKEGYTVINYNVMMADTFPDVLASDDLRANHDHYEVENLHARLRRECRGIIFDTETGEILRRPFHKFFNVNEREETQDHVVDLSRPHAILEKLDGSMIAPFVVIDQMIWGTKMGATDVAKPVEKFVKNNPQYEALANNAILLGLTPIFEWCSRKQRIVLDYKEDTLILTAMRNMKTGEYMDYFYISSFAELAGIPVVRTFEPQTDMKAFVEYVRDLEDLEGFVVRFYDGHMLKLKCHWYLQIHRAKEAILQDRNIVELILDEALDDIKAHLPAEDRFELGRFEHLFNIEVYGQAQLISNMLEHIREENVDRKTFALEIGPNFDQYTRATIFKCWDETDDYKIVDAVKNVIRNNLTKTIKYEAIRDAWFPGVKYND